MYWNRTRNKKVVAWQVMLLSFKKSKQHQCPLGVKMMYFSSLLFLIDLSIILSIICKYFPSMLEIIRDIFCIIIALPFPCSKLFSLFLVAMVCLGQYFQSLLWNYSFEFWVIPRKHLLITSSVVSCFTN